MTKEQDVSAPAGTCDGLRSRALRVLIEALEIEHPDLANHGDGNVSLFSGGTPRSSQIGLNLNHAVDQIIHEVRAALSQSPAPQDVGHASDCATHNEPAYPNGPCDCAQSIAEMCAKAYTSWVPGYKPPNGARDALILAAGAINRLLAPVQDVSAPVGADALLRRWCECPEVTEIHPDDRDPETETLWRETRQYLEGVSAPALAESAKVQGGGLENGWRTMESAPTNRAILIFVPGLDYYGNGGVYAGMLVDMGTGRRWMSFAWAMGRDHGPDVQPTHWAPLPLPPTAPNHAAPASPNVTGADASDAHNRAIVLQAREQLNWLCLDLAARDQSADLRALQNYIMATDATIAELRGALLQMKDAAVYLSGCGASKSKELRQVAEDKFLVALTRAGKAIALTTGGGE